ncbi:MAG: hypothetical protein JW795_23430, partial [Chitinivibrionales bacterium]|nr:hypothetical protein [Chitinivibrionales bacterium]
MKFYKLLLVQGILLTFFCLTYGQNTQKFNLPEEPTGPRFELKDKQWPTTFGAADVCLYEDDKTAAACITIDDNIPDEHEWWIEQANKYGWRFTWYVITDSIGLQPDY